MTLKAPASTEAMSGGCHGLLRMDIELHGRRLPVQTAAGQHLSSSAASWKTCAMIPAHMQRLRQEMLFLVSGPMEGFCKGRLLQRSTQWQHKLASVQRENCTLC